MRKKDFIKECENIAEIINDRIAAEFPIKVKPSVYKDGLIRFEATDTLYYIKSAGHDYEFWNELKSSSVKREAASIKILQTLVDKHKWNSSLFGLGIEEDGPEDYAVKISFLSDINNLGDLYNPHPINPKRQKNKLFSSVPESLAYFLL